MKTSDANRFSIITDDLKRCFVCGKIGGIDLHEIFFGSNREKSKRYGLVVPLCHEGCHQGSKGVHFNRQLDLEMKKIGQKAFEGHYPDEDFLEVFGRNYL